jgi:hypothetical protein
LLILPGAAKANGTDTIKANRNAGVLAFRMNIDIVASITS